MSELKAFDLKVGKNLETDSPIVVGVDNKWNSRIMSGEEVYLKTDVDKLLAKKDAEIAQLKAMLEERNKQVAELKGDIADLRDDKKLTDAILDERNTEIAELKAMLEERNKQVGELKKACNDKDDWCLHTLKENRHHKYKRCLDRAEMCERKRIDAADYRIPREKWDLYEKWHKRWLELAEQFKEEK